MAKNQAVRTLIYDIECSPILGWTYELYDARIIRVEKQQTIMSVSWKWYGEKKVYHSSIQDQTEESLLTHIRDLLDEADIVVGHNSIKFDNRMVQAGMIKYDLTPPSPYKNVDTLRAARGAGKFASNKLTDLGDLLGIGTKTDVTYATLWYDALINKDAKAWKQMKIYNNQDVVLTEKLYERLRPYIRNHPNQGDYTQTDGVCPKCGGDLQKRGFTITRAGKKQRYQCVYCGGWCTEASIKKTGRVVNA